MYLCYNLLLLLQWQKHSPTCFGSVLKISNTFSSSAHLWIIWCRFSNKHGPQWKCLLIRETVRVPKTCRTRFPELYVYYFFSTRCMFWVQSICLFAIFLLPIQSQSGTENQLTSYDESENLPKNAHNWAWTCPKHHPWQLRNIVGSLQSILYIILFPMSLTQYKRNALLQWYRPCSLLSQLFRLLYVFLIKGCKNGGR